MSCNPTAVVPNVRGGGMRPAGQHGADHVDARYGPEGSGYRGTEMAFPGDERLDFESEVLFPLAGLNPERAAAYYAVQEQTSKLSHAGDEAARWRVFSELLSSPRLPSDLR